MHVACMCMMTSLGLNDIRPYSIIVIEVPVCSPKCSSVLKVSLYGYKDAIYVRAVKKYPYTGTKPPYKAT